jgi:hypothetical protein
MIAHEPDLSNLGSIASAILRNFSSAILHPSIKAYLGSSGKQD